MFKEILLMAFVVAAIARPDGGYGHNSESHEHDDDSRSYEFDWNVKSSEEGLDFGHTEKKSEGKTTGYYYVLLPDTRRQKVSYYVDNGSGYVAEISYSGEAQFDSHESKESKEGYYN